MKAAELTNMQRWVPTESLPLISVPVLPEVLLEGMKAEIFAIGTELLMGELTDANSAWLAARLPALGIELQQGSMLGDHLATLSAGIVRWAQNMMIRSGSLREVTVSIETRRISSAAWRVSMTKTRPVFALVASTARSLGGVLLRLLVLSVLWLLRRVLIMVVWLSANWLIGGHVWLLDSLFEAGYVFTREHA